MSALVFRTIWADTGIRPYKMRYDTNVHHRRSIRLQHYDYASRGAYFVTICVQKRLPLFGDVRDGVMQLNDAGMLVGRIWRELETYRDITVDQYVVMPNHLHGIIWIGAKPEGDAPTTKETAPSGGGRTRGSAPTLPAIVQRYKTLTTNRYAVGVKLSNWPAFPGRLWQTNYFEHIIRDDPSLQAIRYYIENNPERWQNDIDNPSGDGTDNVENFVASLHPQRAQDTDTLPDYGILLDSNS